MEACKAEPERGFVGWGILGSQGCELPHPYSLTGHSYYREGAHVLPIM